MSAHTIPPKILKAAAEAKDAVATSTKLERTNAILSERCENLESQIEGLTEARDAAVLEAKVSSEALSIAQAERRIVDETVGRADSLVGELRAERAALLSRCSEAERVSKALQVEQRDVDAKKLELQEALGVERAERRVAVENATRLSDQLGALETRYTADLVRIEERFANVVTERDEARAEKAKLQELLSVAQAERRLMDETSERERQAQDANEERMRAQIASLEGRMEEARKANGSLEEEKGRLQSSVAVAQAEKVLLQELSNRMQQMHTEEKERGRANSERSEGAAGELATRLEASEGALSVAREQIQSLEGERRALEMRLQHSDGALKTLQGEHSSIATERRQLEETVRRQEAQLQTLQLERAASGSLEERYRDMQTQRDAAEQERSQLQEELASIHARVGATEEREAMTSAELRTAQHQLSVERNNEVEREARCKEFQRQRDAVTRERARLQEQVQVLTSESKAASEREHALFIRTTVLEQQLNATTARAAVVEFGGPPTTVELTPGSERSSELNFEAAMVRGGVEKVGYNGEMPPATPVVSVEQAVDLLGNVNAKWGAGGSSSSTQRFEATLQANPPQLYQPVPL